jgi:uncharacterized membrane protein YphA (DoxX/SURF4 family)
MFIAAAIVAGLLAAALLASAYGKLTKDPKQMKIYETVRFPADKLWLLATAEIAGGIGLVVGLFWWPIGAAAAVGVILYFVGAVGAHLRVKDNKFASALIMLLIAVAALTLRVLSI